MDGPSGLNPETNAPLVSGNPRLSAISFVTFVISTPSQPLFVRPNSLSCDTIFLALFDGIAKPRPMLPPVCDIIAAFIPITSPWMLKSGPPELPLLIDASVWINLT